MGLDLPPPGGDSRKDGAARAGETPGLEGACSPGIANDHSYSWRYVSPGITDLLTEDLPADEKLGFMQLAIDRALICSTLVPSVGAVIVNEGKIVGSGNREFIPRGDGTSDIFYAEEVALKDAGEEARGAVLYTTLEPRFIHGQHPHSHFSDTSIVDLILQAGISTVVVGLVDRDPRTNGASIKYLAAQGVKVERVQSPEVERALCNLVGAGKFYFLGA